MLSGRYYKKGKFMFAASISEVVFDRRIECLE